ncbi:myc-associated zinc finger protein [Galendromus occidentalis]|uniref:Myc-associated zinc finger protein n=1 Tax=Galendromus occidentalis TaxID=34638 RepID=A0AAJ6QN24_9ACAR|nr:myc-associated zinc finger protein [Galendromus occidentalis]
MNSISNALTLTPYLGGNQWCKVNGWNNIDQKLICYVDIEGRTKKMIKCAQCDYTTNAPSHYFRHEIKHSKIKPFRCPLCPLTFQRRYKIKYHVVKEHPGEDVENLYY